MALTPQVCHPARTMKHEPTRSGLVCPQCSAARGELELQTQHVIWFLCQSCGHRWVTEESSPARSDALQFQGVPPPQSVAADRQRR
jgi:transposase-like protein